MQAHSPLIVVTELTSQIVMLPLKIALAPLHPLCARCCLPQNNQLMSVTALTSHPEMSPYTAAKADSLATHASTAARRSALVANIQGDGGGDGGGGRGARKGG